MSQAQGLIGEKLGSFRIESVLGSGAMGVVYRGTNEKTGRTAAVKVVSAEFAQGGKIRDRFEREAEILQQFRHPNIVRFLACGRFRGTSYIAMEFVEGVTLEKMHPGSRAPALARGGRAGNPDLRCASLCARARRRPPRFEAVEPDGHGRRQDQADRFRDRQGPRRDGADGHRPNAGNGGVHVSRTDPGHAGRQPQDRPLCARGRLVSDAGRQAAVRGDDAGRSDALPLERAAAAAQCQARGDSQRAGRARS